MLNVGNVQSFTSTSLGVRDAGLEMSIGFSNYSNSRSKGLTNSTNFYTTVASDI